MRFVFLFALVVLLFAPQCSFAGFVTFDFEDIADNSQHMSFTYSKSGIDLTISRSSSTSFVFSNNVGATGFGTRSLSPFNGTGGATVGDWFIVEISRPVSSISIQLGDFGQDRDALFLQAHALSNLQGNFRTATDTLPGGGSSFASRTLSVAADPFGTSPVSEFRSFSVYGGDLSGSFPNSVFYDNIAVEFTAVPEPGSLSLVGTATLALLARFRWSRKSRRVSKLQNLD